jgi:hypothetical protein
MSQQTNLNVAPYFDDFDPNNDYYRVLFKPGYPVQARELTTLQSILQNQIEKFGQHFFKEGARVIPGNIGYNRLYYAVQLNNTYLGVPVSAYADQLVGSKILGQTSGVSAYVDKVLLPQDSENGNLTLYVNYINSSIQNNNTQQFSDGETLVCDRVIASGLLGNTTIEANSPFASTLSTNATATGSCFSITNGVYFVRGNFVNVETETLILDQYTNSPNYRVGLFISEEIINSNIDESLNDNSQGYNNYASPGADRLKISVGLFKKSLNDFDDTNFIELATIQDGVLKSTNNFTSSQNSIFNTELNNALARRTYDESGDYCVRPYEVTILESLNDNLGNRGVFDKGQITYGGMTPTDNLSVYKISPGKSFVRGYEIETLNSTFIDVEKPRTTKTLESQSINYNTGPTLKLNRVYGTPEVGFGNTYVLSLRDSRVGVSSTSPAGNEIGVARVYDFRLESGSYNSSNSNINQWNISLFDVQTITNITLNVSSTFSVPTFVKGNNSGATGFLKDSVTVGTALTLYEVKGSFIPNESLSFNGVNDGRIAIAVTSYGISDIKSVRGVVGSGSTFTADVIQTPSFLVGIATITPFSGVSTVRSSNTAFPGNIVKIGDIVRYSNLSASADPTLATVVSVGSSTVQIVGVTTVTGVASGTISTTSVTSVTDLQILSTSLESSSDNTLYTKLPKNNISSVDLTGASLTIRKVYNVEISANKINTISAGQNEIFLPFDEERYSLIRSDGATEPLSSDKMVFTEGGTQLKIYNLGSNSSAKLITTLRKSNPTSKIKVKNRVNSIIVSNSKYSGSGIGSTTLGNGLTSGSYPFGTRVEDDIISLNTPDIIEIHGIFESVDNSDPSAPKISLTSIRSSSTTTAELLIGELLIGQTSGSIAICVEKINDSDISFIYKNNNRFKEGETVVFQESNVSAIISTLSSPSFEISSNYKFDNGQNSTFYGYGSIVRKPFSYEPTKKIKVYFSNAYYDATDNGDVTTIASYNQFNYSKEIQSVDGISNSDIIDIRPRVSSYSVTENSRSPLEFYGRLFNGAGNSASNILSSEESILTTFSYYLGRIDRIFLSKNGTFQVKYGTPAENPRKPIPVDDALEIATISLPPYLYNVSQASIQFLDHKRYQMTDIKQIENRLKNLEYYTALSILESNTVNLFVPDSDGFNRFKSGFFVDNFSTFKSQDETIEINNSIDVKNKELRPKHYTESIDLIFGPIVGANQSADLAFSPIEGINVRKSSDIVTLEYGEVEWIKQTSSTRSESITPFLIPFWQGTIEMTPSSDTWVDTATFDSKITQFGESCTETFSKISKTKNINEQSGFASILWNSWGTNWVGVDISEDSNEKINSVKVNNQFGRLLTKSNTSTTVLQDNKKEARQTPLDSKKYFRSILSDQFDTTSIGDRIISRDLISYIRSRNIQFISKKLKPSTQLYAFFDGVNVTRYCIPKLLEISMISGTFEVGEDVIGTSLDTGLGPNLNKFSPKITFRVAQSNHKEGEYDNPTTTYSNNPYTNQILPESYSSTSTILNIDTFSLANQTQGQYGGWIESGMSLVGKTSGARATITNVRLITDLSSTLIGNFFIPDPNNINHPRFEAGPKTFTLTNDEQNNQNASSTVAEESFIASGILEITQDNVISVRNTRVENKQVFESSNTSRTLGTETVFGKQGNSFNTNAIVGWYDPLAQSFLVEDETGIFLTKCEVFFSSKDDMDIPVSLQLRTMKNGTPSQKVLPLSEIVLNPTDVNTSNDGSVATTFEFKAPVYLEGGQEYAICLSSNSTKYSVYVSRVGEIDLLTQTLISNQPYLGFLFKSQNTSSWEASQWEDLKFTLYRAEFINSGSVELYNPKLNEGNGQTPILSPNPLILNSRKIRIGIGSTLQDSGLLIGNTILQKGTNASGNLTGFAGIATGTLSISNSGIGYTPSSGGLTFNNVNLSTITGKGKGAIANITISNGVAVAATVVSGGYGYQVGDVLGITSIGASPAGRDSKFSLVSIASTNLLILDNVQGEFVVGSAKTIQYVNSSGITTTLNNSTGGNVQISTIDVDSDGLHIQVNHQNHGMYFSDNLVKISGVLPDIIPTKLNVEYDASSTSPISVVDASSFTTFENVGVGTTNAGFLLIGDEIIKYTSVSGNLIGGDIERGSNPITYPTGTPVYKYELGGINLSRINKTHDLNDVTIDNPITFDSYYIKLDTSEKFDVDNDDRSDDTGYPKLYINKTKSSGGYNVRSSQNIPFEIITPMVQNLTVRGTTISAEVRTVTGRSISGNEVPYQDSGFESVVLNQSNYLDSPRIICSDVNEVEQLSSIPENKSMNLRLFMSTTDTRVSPVVDAQRISTILTSNRVNSVITNYATDNRVNGIETDPTSCQYISKEIVLENSASSIKIVLNAYINDKSDIRAFYATNNSQGFDPIFIPFPGYSNLNSNKQIISLENSNGQSDILISKSNSYDFDSSSLDFKEYTFTADNLSAFRSYRIKLLLTSTSQVYVPRIKDLRVIALA